jgi:hypothetical protein
MSKLLEASTADEDAWKKRLAEKRGAPSSPSLMERAPFRFICADHVICALAKLLTGFP